MATAKPQQLTAPYAGATKDTVSANTGNVEVQIVFKLRGTIAQVQADWATLIAATITANSATVGWDGGQI
jgi:hypothetical protein